MSLKREVICTLCQRNGSRCPVEPRPGTVGARTEAAILDVVAPTGGNPLLFCRFYQPSSEKRS